MELALWRADDGAVTARSKHGGVHPDILGSLSLEQFLYLRISSQHGAVKKAVDEVSEQHRARGKTEVVVPHFLLAYKLVAESNLIGTIAEITA
ncbi:hypothetical protein [Cupriavidus alkaliphilus]|uniref:hypothetical protein n=1 Tax=Cupriavidus alkaliphilus TaxID=942866 RepID=UPI00161093DA|nr:hypothetical protein [Cupriavidus alkaliphilus]MBB3013167.1 hypothetical protein [Cupriavidus alkaliphilus]